MSNSICIPSARRIGDGLFCVVLGVIGLSLAGQFSRFVLGHPRVFGLVPAVYVDYESSIPTWYSSVALLLAAVLLALVAVVKRTAGDRFRWHWATLAAIIMLLSADEIAMFHELPIDPLRAAWGTGGLLHYAWVVPGLALVAAVSCLYLRFFLCLPPRTRWQLGLAAATFVGGAIGVEMLSGAQADRFGEDNFGYAMIITVEEFMEMLGVVILIRALLEYIENELGGLHIQMRPGS